MYKHLTSEQRYGISVLLAVHTSFTAIAQIIGVSIATVSREVKRNSENKNYQYEEALRMANARKKRCANHRIKDDVKKRVLCYLTEEQWSPKQISGYLKKEGVLVSYTYIYNLIKEDKKAGGTLYMNLRHRGKHRRHIASPIRKKILDRTSIHDRPKEADGTRPGDFELDTIVGKNNKGVIVTLVDRCTNLLLMKKSPKGKDAEAVAQIVIDLLLPYKHILKTITTDNGCEFAEHKKIAQALGVTVYFADPYCSWQKGCIENTNKLIRQYIPKGTDFSTITDEQVRQIQSKINRRPREKFNFCSPKISQKNSSVQFPANLPLFKSRPILFIFPKSSTPLHFPFRFTSTASTFAMKFVGVAFFLYLCSVNEMVLSIRHRFRQR